MYIQFTSSVQGVNCQILQNYFVRMPHLFQCFLVFWRFYCKILRSSCQKVFCNKDGLRKFAKFTRKHLCRSLFFKYCRLWFCKIFKDTFFTENLRTTSFKYWKTLKWIRISTTQNLPQNGFPLICTFPYKDRIHDSLLLR